MSDHHGKLLHIRRLPGGMHLLGTAT